MKTFAKKLGGLWKIKKLDREARRSNVTLDESLHNTMRWLAAAQDGSPDDGVSFGFAVFDGWAISYPETTGYILQTVHRYIDRFGDDGGEWTGRARRMAHWEADILGPEGGTPGNFQTPRQIPVAFNTGQVLLGWADYLRANKDDKVRDAAVRAGRWLVECTEGGGFFKHGVSSHAEHGDLVYNTMVSWGLMELADALGDETFAEAAVRTVAHYAGYITDDHWPARAGFTNTDSDFPLTHTLGYTIQGMLEVGLLADRQDFVDAAKNMLQAALPCIDRATGFLPGRIRPRWDGGAGWACCTGSVQFSACYARCVEKQLAPADWMDVAESLAKFVVGTQVPGNPHENGCAYGVRGSYPFSMSGYERATYPNWAAKFHIDALLHLHKAGRIAG